MSIQARLETLAERHQALEAALNEERRHAALDELKISDLKRKKLALKDEIATLHSMKDLPTQRRPS
ncbi:MAG: YdcH family protein [Parvularcula sp.]|nr:YdcH family protein [Parvularcula sp.]